MKYFQQTIIIDMFYIFHDDKPIYELNFNEERSMKDCFFVHSALDFVDQALLTKKDYCLGPIKIYDQVIFAYVNPVNLRFLFYLANKRESDKSTDKAMKQFFSKVNDALAVALLNPLYQYKTVIKSSVFDQKVKSYVRQHLKNLLPISKK